MHNLMHGLAELLFPPACALCQEPLHGVRHGIVCGVCLSRIVPLTLPTCERCGHPRLTPNAPLPAGVAGETVMLPPCRWCRRLPPYVRAARSATRTDEGTGAAMVHALKYEGWTQVARPMAERMARLDFPADVVSERAALVPVPLHRTRQRERGYNQSQELSIALGAAWRIPVWTNVLTRRRATRSQVQLTPSDRARNVSRVFETPAGVRARLRGTHLVLVDDVITTAATLNAAAQALIDGGARIISFATFGRAPEPGDRSVPDLDSDLD